jgi:D-amino peptidase
MKIYIMTDMEGISGIRRADDCNRGGSPRYEECRKLMAADINAAIAGAFDGGAKEVVVCDSHMGGYNFPMELMDERARYVENGGIRELMGRIDSSFAGFFAVGYHAMAGTINAFLDHTQSGEQVFEYSINGKPYGELGQQCILAGAHNVPQLLVTGDKATCVEALELTPGIETVVVKEAYGRERVNCIHPKKAHEMIRAAAKRAIGLVGKIKPFKLPKPYDVRLVFTRTNYAEAIWRQRPWIERLDGRTVRLVTEDEDKILAVF